MKKLSLWALPCLLITLFDTRAVHAANIPDIWTLPDAIERMTQQAPEIRAADAEVSASRSNLERAGSWENPTVELEANNAMGIDDGQGGYDLNRVAITQPLGFSRRAYQRTVAEKEFKGSEEKRRYQTLLLQNRAASLFYALQVTQAKYQLAEERLRLADGMLSSNKSDPLVRYLSPAEKVRLGILREQAQQAYLDVKVEWEADQRDFCYVLQLPTCEKIRVEDLKDVPAKPELQNREELLSKHPAILSANYEREAAQARISLTKAEHLNAPELTLYQERDVLAGQRENIIGVGVSMQLPLWNSSKRGVAKARAEFERADADYMTSQRDLEMNWTRQRSRLIQLIESANRFKTQLLDPTEKLLNITRRSFAAGDADVLSLVDAHNSYFDARLSYLALLHEAWMTAADLNLAAGLPLITEVKNISGEQKP